VNLSGWSVQFLNGAGHLVLVPVPPSTWLPARGHLLFAGRSYSLSAYARPDLTLPERVAGGVRLCDATGRAVDAIGPKSQPQAQAKPSSTTSSQSFREGQGLPAWAFDPAADSPAQDSPTEASRQAKPARLPPQASGSGALPLAQFACVRRVDASGRRLRDSNDNAADWLVVSVSGELSGHAARLGAPGPQSTASAQLAIQPPAAAPSHSAAAAALASVAAAQARRSKASSSLADGSRKLPFLRRAEAVGANSRLRTLTLRYSLLNRSPQVLKRFRLRILGATSGPSPAGIADVRLLPLPHALRAMASPGKAQQPAGEIPMLYGVLDEPPAQASGGGLNSSLTFLAAGGTVPGGIAPGGSAELRILLGVQKPGRYRLLLDGSGLFLAFDGYIGDGSAQAAQQGAQQAVEAAWLWGAAGAGPILAQARGAGAAGSAGAPGVSGAEARGSGGSGEAGRTIVADIVLAGNTEDGETGPEDEASPLVLSSSDFAGEAGSIRLRFSGPLEVANGLAGATFGITVNGREVSGEPVAAGQNTVVLKLPGNSLRRGDRVALSWANLRDARGRLLAGQAGPLSVP